MFLKLLSYPRSLLGVILLPIHTALCATAIIIANILFNNRKLEDHIVEFWTRNCCRMFGVKVVTKGLENRPPGGFLYVFNHTSFFDIFAMNGWLGSFRFGAKIELFKIPVFGAGMRRAGILPIARERREEVFKVYQAAEARIKAGERFALAPEGTRQKTETLGNFKSGPFIFAINAKAPIVPVIVKGAAAIMPKGNIIPNWGVWSRTITLEVLPAVDATAYTIEQRPQLQERVRQMMLPYFKGDDF
ncbi:1-acyl-sn-glycerol-3-phosphate acyltransferase [Bdellovibrio sp. NC01]|uniref:lysophospholipid acyltransferase family protein n=1 Tax=Bdellovibrio sp. NC01 TaxID=2220073 RepID=UPI001158BC3C|nr:lysophospholipid acyltransferase family protein [Bdellovibrio sp. NC01]QDK37667.1 1-acyl-sn-glycerol-3-phosphate acyltransferase [Bdellovibrio sp. NC01]